jgi:hypothetical protein
VCEFVAEQVGPPGQRRPRGRRPDAADQVYHRSPQAITELCDCAEAAITAVRDLATGSALDDAALAAFLDQNGGLL